MARVLPGTSLDPPEGAAGDNVTAAGSYQPCILAPVGKPWALRGPGKKTTPFRPGAVSRRSATRSGGSLTSAGKQVTPLADDVKEILDTGAAKPQYPFVADEFILLIPSQGQFYHVSRHCVASSSFDFDQLVGKFLTIPERLLARTAEVSLGGSHGYMAAETHQVHVVARVQEDIRWDVVRDAVDRIQKFYNDLLDKTNLELELKLSLICVNFLEHVYSALTFPNCLNGERPVHFHRNEDDDGDDDEYVSESYSAWTLHISGLFQTPIFLTAPALPERPPPVRGQEARQRRRTPPPVRPGDRAARERVPRSWPKGEGKDDEEGH